MMMRWVTPKMLAEHSKECPLGPGSCDKCYWHRKGPNRRRRLLIPGLQKTWLACCQKKISGSGSELRLGCVVCQRLLADDPTRGGDSLASFKVPMEELPKHFSNFRRHMNSERHVRGLLQWQSEDDKVVWAPPAEEFRACLENLRKGGSARGGGTSDKATLMTWCLSEAILQRYRSSLRLAKSLVLVRDERHGQLV